MSLQKIDGQNPPTWSALELALRYVLDEEERHRSRNGLQIIIGNLERQAASASSEEVRHSLSCACEQIAGLGRLHSMLDRPEHGELTINCWRYVRQLARLVDLLILAPRGHRLEMTASSEAKLLAAEEGQLHILGLISVELMTNAAKHAFARDAAGHIKGHLSVLGDELTFMIADNGLGQVIPPQTAGCKGMQYIAQLSDEAGGACSWSFSARGTTAKVRLPLQRRRNTVFGADWAVAEAVQRTL